MSTFKNISFSSLYWKDHEPDAPLATTMFGHERL
jgi:hypothetical protein